MTEQNVLPAPTGAEGHNYSHNTLIDSKAHFGNLIQHQRSNIHVHNLIFAFSNVADADPRAYRMITEDVRHFVEAGYNPRFAAGRSGRGGRGRRGKYGRGSGNFSFRRGGGRKCSSRGQTEGRELSANQTHTDSALSRLYHKAYSLLRDSSSLGQSFWQPYPRFDPDGRKPQDDAPAKVTEPETFSVARQDWIKQNQSVLMFCGLIMAALAGRNLSHRDAWALLGRISRDPLFPYCSLIVALCIAHVSNIAGTMSSLYGLTYGDHLIFEDAFKQELKIPLTHLEHSFIFGGFLRKHYLDTDGQSFVDVGQYNLMVGSRRGDILQVDELCNPKLIRKHRRLVMAVWLHVSGLQCLACESGILLTNDRHEYHCPACKRFYRDAYTPQPEDDVTEELQLQEVLKEDIIGPMPDLPTSQDPLLKQRRPRLEIGRLQNVDLHILPAQPNVTSPSDTLPDLSEKQTSEEPALQTYYLPAAELDDQMVFDRLQMLLGRDVAIKRVSRGGERGYEYAAERELSFVEIGIICRPSEDVQRHPTVHSDEVLETSVAGQEGTDVQRADTEEPSKMTDIDPNEAHSISPSRLYDVDNVAFATMSRSNEEADKTSSAARYDSPTQIHDDDPILRAPADDVGITSIMPKSAGPFVSSSPPDPPASAPLQAHQSPGGDALIHEPESSRGESPVESGDLQTATVVLEETSILELAIRQMEAAKAARREAEAERLEEDLLRNAAREAARLKRQQQKTKSTSANKIKSSIQSKANKSQHREGPVKVTQADGDRFYTDRPRAVEYNNRVPVVELFQDSSETDDEPESYERIKGSHQRVVQEVPSRHSKTAYRSPINTTPEPQQSPGLSSSSRRASALDTNQQSPYGPGDRSRHYSETRPRRVQFVSAPGNRSSHYPELPPRRLPTQSSIPGTTDRLSSEVAQQRVPNERSAYGPGNRSRHYSELTAPQSAPVQRHRYGPGNRSRHYSETAPQSAPIRASKYGPGNRSNHYLETARQSASIQTSTYGPGNRSNHYSETVMQRAPNQSYTFVPSNRSRRYPKSPFLGNPSRGEYPLEPRPYEDEYIYPGGFKDTTDDRHSATSLPSQRNRAEIETTRTAASEAGPRRQRAGDIIVDPRGRRIFKVPVGRIEPEIDERTVTSATRARIYQTVQGAGHSIVDPRGLQRLVFPVKEIEPEIE